MNLYTWKNNQVLLECNGCLVANAKLIFSETHTFAFCQCRYDHLQINGNSSNNSWPHFPEFSFFFWLTQLGFLFLYYYCNDFEDVIVWRYDRTLRFYICYMESKLQLSSNHREVWIKFSKKSSCYAFYFPILKIVVYLKTLFLISKQWQITISNSFSVYFHKCFCISHAFVFSICIYFFWSCTLKLSSI